ncbi:MAG TPA: TIM44-like domain-containing protein, partial [Burkholderiaceae bacterium]|nr:TIM44-like domain-containing protein [Burkholderiaceae bacterium]
MKRILLSLFIALAGLSFVAADVQAKRLGGGTSSGIKRQTPPPQPAQQVPPQQPPQQQAATTPNAAAPTAAAAAAPKRSWLGPIAGLAAGLGLAALLSHLGLGAEFGSLLTMLLLGLLAVFAVRFLLRRFGANAAANREAQPLPQGPQGLQWATAGASASGAPAPRQADGFDAGSMFRAPVAAPVAAAQAQGGIPAGFDSAAFERAAKLIFIRMQAANDAGNLEDLRQFATPEMFATFRLELQDRHGA